MTEQHPTIDPAQFRRVLGHYPTGVAAITSQGADGAPLVLVVGTFTSVSLDPPLVGFLPTRESYSWAAIRETGHFAVNVLGADQAALCGQLAGRGDKFAGVDYTLSQRGLPLVAVALVTICLLDTSSLQQLPRDEQAHHLIGAFQNAMHAQIAPEAFDRIVAQIAIAAEHLQRAVRHAAARVGGKTLGHGGKAGLVRRARGDLAGGGVEQRARRLQFGGHIGQLELGVLELGNRLAELLAVPGVCLLYPSRCV